MLSASKWKGQLYGLPIWGGIYAEIYNRDLVDEGGPRSRQAAEDVGRVPRVVEEADRQRQWATAVLGGKTDTTTRVLLMWIWSNGGEAFNADMTEATFAKNPKSLEAIKFYLGLCDEGEGRRARADDHQLPRADQPVRAGQDRDDAQRLLGDRQGQRRQPGDEGQGVRRARPGEHRQCADARDRHRVVHFRELPASGRRVEVHQVRRRQEVGDRARARSRTGCRCATTWPTTRRSRPIRCSRSS